MNNIYPEPVAFILIFGEGIDGEQFLKIIALGSCVKLCCSPSMRISVHFDANTHSITDIKNLSA